MDIVVQKFGGTSVATLDQIARVAALTAKEHRSQPVVAVVSARGKTTDELLALAGQVSGGARSDAAAREVDQLLATGECVSAALLALALQRIGTPAVSLTGPQAGVEAAGSHGAGIIASIETYRIRRLLAEGNLVVVAGFQGVDRDSNLVTLGRGGSDTTAVALAAALGARLCEIRTDVDGVFTADPRVVADAKVLPTVDSAVMAEMAFAGATVLHSRAVELAAMRRIDVLVRSSFTDRLGTVVPGRSDDTMLETRSGVVAITHDLDVARLLINATGPRRDLAADMLGVLAEHSVPVDLVARSGPHEDVFRMGCTIRRRDVAGIKPYLEEAALAFNGGVRVDENVGKLSLIGMGLLNRPQYSARMLTALARADIPTSWVSTSNLRTSVVVPLDRVTDGVHAVHREFELDREDAGVACTAPT